MSREPSRDWNSKNKFRWKIIGNGKIDSKKGVIEIYFDLLSKPVLMNLFPERNIDKSLSDEIIEMTVFAKDLKQLIAA
jgi:hypothetical protein